jgi:hypothetical protein
MLQLFICCSKGSGTTWDMTDHLTPPMKSITIGKTLVDSAIIFV